MSDIPHICQCGHHETFHFKSMSGIRIYRLCLQVNGRCTPSEAPSLPDHSVEMEKLSEVIRIVQLEQEGWWQHNPQVGFVQMAAVIIEALLRPWPAEGQMEGYWQERQNWFDQASAEEIAKVFLAPAIG